MKYVAFVRCKQMFFLWSAPARPTVDRSTWRPLVDRSMTRPRKHVAFIIIIIIIKEQIKVT